MKSEKVVKDLISLFFLAILIIIAGMLFQKQESNRTESKSEIAQEEYVILEAKTDELSKESNYENAILLNINNLILDTDINIEKLTKDLNARLVLIEDNKVSNESRERLRDIKQIYIVGNEEHISKDLEKNLRNEETKVRRIYANRENYSFKESFKILLSKVLPILLTLVILVIGPFILR